MTVGELETAIRNLGFGGFEDTDSEVVFADGSPVTAVSSNMLGQVVLS